MNHGGGKDFTITPNAGHTISDVLVDGSSVGAVSTYSFTNVSANHVVSAEFVPEDYTIVESTVSTAMSVICYPNPFYPSTTIKFIVPVQNWVQLSFYHISGQKVCDLLTEQMAAGSYSISWNGIDNWGRHVSAGTYVALVQSGFGNFSVKMLYLK